MFLPITKRVGPTYLEATVASGAKIIVSGDKLLLACDGYRGVSVMKARAFVEEYL